MKRNLFYDHLIKLAHSRNIPEAFTRRHLRSAVWQALWIMLTKEDVVDVILCNLQQNYQDHIMYVETLQKQKEYFLDAERWKKEKSRLAENTGVQGVPPAGYLKQSS
jgi:hypothetical protein